MDILNKIELVIFFSVIPLITKTSTFKMILKAISEIIVDFYDAKYRFSPRKILEIFII